MEDIITTEIRRIVAQEIDSAVKEALEDAIRQRRIPTPKPRTIYLKGSTSEVETLFSVTTAASLLSVSREWIYQQIKSGEIRSIVDLGGTRSKYRIPASELARFVNSRAL